MDYKKEYEKWCTDAYFDDATKAELKAIAGDEKEIEDRFYRTLEFGTAGLRGVIGAGTNRMNIYTVRQATQGLANYILSQNGQNKGVAIAHDSRLMADEFTDAAALCLAANGIKAYVFKSLRPVPELSFAVRELGCIAGIVITASHNPREYNGYKVYWEDGAQVTPPHDTSIMDEVGKVTSFDMVKTMAKEEAVKAGLYEVISDDVDEKYFAQLRNLSIHPEIIKQMAKDIKIVYTPLHGTGNIPVRRVLKELGFENVYVVKEQELPDGDFPTVSYPNPESEEAFELAVKLGNEIGADILLATDPDADRVGIAVKDYDGSYRLISGNEDGIMLTDYILSSRKANGTLPEKPVLVKTIVTTKLINKLCEKYGCELKNVLTGFKYIGEVILNLEKKGEEDRYVFGFEESYGYLAGTYVRDKDAVVASMLVCEMAAFYKKHGKSLAQVIDSLYEEYGYYLNHTSAFEFDGAAGMEKMNNIMAEIRENIPTEIDGKKVVKVSDYLLKYELDTVTGEKTAIDLPTSNVISFGLEGDNGVIIRPSGTEPKIKAYITAVGKDFNDAESIKDSLVDASKKLLGIE